MNTHAQNQKSIRICVDLTSTSENLSLSLLLAFKLSELVFSSLSLRVLYPQPHEVPEEYLRRGPADRHHTTDSSNSRKSSASSSASSSSLSSSSAPTVEDGCKSEGKNSESETRKIKMDKKEGIVQSKMEEEKVGCLRVWVGDENGRVTGREERA